MRHIQSQILDPKRLGEFQKSHRLRNSLSNTPRKRPNHVTSKSYSRRTPDHRPDRRDTGNFRHTTIIVLANETTVQRPDRGYDRTHPHERLTQRRYSSLKID